MNNDYLNDNSPLYIDLLDGVTRSLAIQRFDVDPIEVFANKVVEAAGYACENLVDVGKIRYMRQCDFTRELHKLKGVGQVTLAVLDIDGKELGRSKPQSVALGNTVRVEAKGLINKDFKMDVLVP